MVCQAEVGRGSTGRAVTWRLAVHRAVPVCQCNICDRAYFVSLFWPATPDGILVCCIGMSHSKLPRQLKADLSANLVELCPPGENFVPSVHVLRDVVVIIVRVGQNVAQHVAHACDGLGIRVPDGLLARKRRRDCDEQCLPNRLTE